MLRLFREGGRAVVLLCFYPRCAVRLPQSTQAAGIHNATPINYSAGSSTLGPHSETQALSRPVASTGKAQQIIAKHILQKSEIVR